MLCSPILALALAAPSAAEAPSSACVERTASGYREPPTLSALFACQRAWRLRLVSSIQALEGRPPSQARLDALDAASDRQTKDYVARHPESLGERKTADSSPIAGGEPEAIASEANSDAFSKQWARTLAAMGKNLSAGAPAMRGDFQQLADFLAVNSKRGERGITPEASTRILDYLQAAQGGATPQMRQLLEMLSKDGARLTDPTVAGLKGAARDARAAGLDLGLDEALQRWILDAATDPAGAPAPRPAVN